MNIDPDALNRIFKQKHPHHHLIEATKHALGMYTDGLQNNLNLCLETTLAGHGATQRIQKAATARYFLIGYFVGLNDVHLNLQRIRARVARGGHDIPEPLVRKRYTESSTQLIKVRHYFNELHVIDNSQDAFSLQWSQYGHRVIHHTNSLENWASMLLNATP
ncbi:MAG: hypothetical protein A3J38_03900 [Gammaproteobacteria bacterium RIFCSPHIGHO2_12_FULL_45_9]|nr:MAG: hypothetical protein A3J38_03900 [Gammaproteobacteria bacterium RIFCSPHIGHO2_12_FULL_45_9]